MHHPGFHYSPEGDKKGSPHTKEGPTPRRARRKEPLSKLLKNAKTSSDGQKRTSLGATLLSPVSQLALGTIGRSRSLVNQSQESLDPGDHYDHSDREEGEGPHPQDADDEDDSGLGMGKRLQVPGKSSKKRLNPQVSVDSIDQWKNFNMSPSDLKAAKESLKEHPPLLRTPHVTEEPPDPPLSSLLVPGTDPQAVGNIWADHRVRRAMFPTRQNSTMVPDDEEEDIYQMFVPTEPRGPAEPEPPAASQRSEVTTSPRHGPRPCSWHLDQVPTVQIDPPSTGDRVLRRASSVGEKASEVLQSPDNDPRPLGNLEVIHTESSSNEISGSSSAEQLTLDDIENVYDNISYEDLKTMGLIRRDQESRRSMKQTPREARGLQGPNTGVKGSRETVIEPESSTDSKLSSTQEVAPSGTCELKIVEEENIYDTLCFIETPPPVEKKGQREENGGMQGPERDSLLASEPDLTGCESLGGFVSEESLHFGDEEVTDSSRVAQGALEPDYSSSSASETFSQRSHTGDRMSEQVDEIWNDLENYIKVNERKADRLPAAFPVSASESPEKPSSRKNSPKKTTSPQARSPPTKSPPAHHPNPNPLSTTPLPQPFTIPILNVPELLRETTFEDEDPSPRPPSLSLPAIPEPLPGTVKSIRNKLARLSSGSFRLEDDELGELPHREPFQRERQLQPPIRDLHSLFPGELAGLDSPLASSSLLLGDSTDYPQELLDKTKNRVFLMARQYSQKIKRANQLLRMRSMDPGDACGRSRTEKKHKDLADILEEKKQGGAAIGARIAEYSQLYDQVMFRDPPTSPTPHHSHPGLSSSPSMPESSFLGDDWLHSTYSNGELASFVSDWQSQGGGARASTPQRTLTPACSVPALKTLPPPPTTPPTQRWSTCVSAPSEKEEHIYSSIKRHPSFNAPSPSNPSTSPKTSPYTRCQSGSSLGEQQQGKENNQNLNQNQNRAGSNRNCTGTERLQMPSLGQTGRQHSLPERSTCQSELTLQDGQQVVVLNRNSALSMLQATQNYLANFKDNGDDDDDDYVEIRSEGEMDCDQDGSAPPPRNGGSFVVLSEGNRGPAVQCQSQSLPSTPVKSCHPLGSLDRERLQQYLWAEPQNQNQTTIVQSLREKFQCLSSSSIA